MKCNKCLKKIPEGEEIRFSSHDSSWRGDGGGYSGCYCEDCWKKSSYYQNHEDRGKSKDSSSSSNSGVPSWGWFGMGVIVGAIIVGIVCWTTKGN